MCDAPVPGGVLRWLDPLSSEVIHPTWWLRRLSSVIGGGLAWREAPERRRRQIPIAHRPRDSHTVRSYLAGRSAWRHPTVKGSFAKARFLAQGRRCYGRQKRVRSKGVTSFYYNKIA